MLVSSECSTSICRCQNWPPSLLVTAFWMTRWKEHTCESWTNEWKDLLEIRNKICLKYCGNSGKKWVTAVLSAPFWDFWPTTFYTFLRFLTSKRQRITYDSLPFFYPGLPANYKNSISPCCSFFSIRRERWNDIVPFKIIIVLRSPGSKISTSANWSSMIKSRIEPSNTTLLGMIVSITRNSRLSSSRSR